jgi:glutamyl-tRNA synthetase/glutamyl-Q tRNA(Asp) synthetase
MVQIDSSPAQASAVLPMLNGGLDPVRLSFPADFAKSPILTRFAPSPTGYLHLGHVASVIFVWGLARKFNGEVVLRMEDHDRQRSRPKFEAAIMSELTSLGFIARTPDRKIGSVSSGLFSRQSDHLERFEHALEMLAQQNLIYGCECSRSDLQQGQAQNAGDEIPYRGTCRNKDLPIKAGLGIRLRLSSETVEFHDSLLGACKQMPARQCGDLLLRDRHGNWTYQFAVVVDDLYEGINLVIRGQDLLQSTGRQILLRQALGHTDRPLFVHHPLLMDPDGESKLSKRLASLSVTQMLLDGKSAEQILGEAAWRSGLIDINQPVAQGDLANLFSRCLV